MLVGCALSLKKPAVVQLNYFAIPPSMFGGNPAQAGIDVDALALQLQRDGAQAFMKSWKKLLERIADKRAALASARETCA